MSNSTKDNPIEKRLIQEILSPSDPEINMVEIVKIIRQEFSVDFCLIISDWDNLTSFYITNNNNNNTSKLTQKITKKLIEQPWIQTIKNEPTIKSISHVNKKKGQIDLPFFEELNIKSLLGIRTDFKGQVNGLILLGKMESYQWNHTEKKILKEVADLVTIACQLKQSQTKTDDSLQNNDSHFSLSNIPQLLEENPILRLWWEITRKQLDKQLEWNKKLIYNMITIMSDQTRNPLAIIKMVITILRTKELPIEELEKRINMLEGAWNKLNQINERILQLKHLKSDNLHLNRTPIQLQKFIEEITKDYQNQWQEYSEKMLNISLNFEIDINEKFSTDQKQLTKILQELLTNAGKFSVPKSTINLEIRQEKQSNEPQIIMTLSNISSCVSQENIADFFEPFYREQTVIDTAIPGIGIGLNIVKDLVDLLQGKITMESIPTETPKHCKIVVRLVFPQSLSS
jgi:signal transduction histidine kinase